MQSDVKDGFAEWLPGGMEEARKRFGPHCAAGRFGVVKKDGSAPRLVGDSSISTKRTNAYKFTRQNRDLVFSLCLIKMVFVIGSFTGPRTLVLPGRVLGGRVWLQHS